ncbi:MAG: hypothetical protein QXV69_09300 [Sulfolobaceae archaeon]
MNEHNTLLDYRERIKSEIIGKISELLNELNQLIVNHREELVRLGILSKILVVTSVIHMHKYDPDVYMKSWWEDLKSLVNKIGEIASDSSSIIRSIISEIEALWREISSG